MTVNEDVRARRARNVRLRVSHSMDDSYREVGKHNGSHRSPSRLAIHVCLLPQHSALRQASTPGFQLTEEFGQWLDPRIYGETSEK